MAFQNLLHVFQENNVEYVDLRFTDILGVWHHMTFPASFVTEEFLHEGVCFDGSSIVAWRQIHESDMIMKPDVTRWAMDPFSAQPTVILFCDILDPLTQACYIRDPRSIGRRAQEYLRETGIANRAFFGPEAEFFVFDGVRYGVGPHGSFYELTSDEFESQNHTSLGPLNHGHRPKNRSAYFPVPPIDSLQDMRNEMTTTMALMGLVLERHHHEVAPAQHEIGFKFGTLLEAADNLQIYKYVVKNVAHIYGKTATFMPKPIFGDNGSGMHVHQSLWQDTTPLFAGEKYAGLSEIALYYIGGILKHAKALNAFTNPTTNSYKRLVPGYEAPVMAAYSGQNRSASCRIPTSSSPKAKRVEVRFPDPLSNPYLCFASLLMAGLDGIQNKIHPGEASDKNLFADKEIAATLPKVAGSLREALESLEKDRDFLCKGGVFTEDFIESYLALKWEEVKTYECQPHPLEFQKYYSG